MEQAVVVLVLEALECLRFYEHGVTKKRTVE
jgi:hypothetical protein